MFFINGSYVSETDAKISVLDLSILRGFGVFDYLRTYSGKPFHLSEHLLRLQYSAQQLGLELPYTLEKISKIINEVLRLNQLAEASIKIIATGGISPDQFTPQHPATLIVFAYPLASYPPEYFTKGINVVTTRLMRSMPSCKTTQYIPGIIALQQGRSSNAKEALYVNAKGEILEATTSNFFGVKEGKLYTCMSEEVLAGITREVVLKIAKGQFPICFEPIAIDEIDQLDEAFITASNKEVMPVVAIDSTPIGSGKVGPITTQAMSLFRNYTKQDNWPLLDIPRYAAVLQTSDIQLLKK
ncbi:MAG: aminotransferase class IV [Parachlamydiales bacterium]|nr:aminotransferase class IV [Candidatus Acheromyda pituitae]